MDNKTQMEYNPGHFWAVFILARDILDRIINGPLIALVNLIKAIQHNLIWPCCEENICLVTGYDLLHLISKSNLRIG